MELYLAPQTRMYMDLLNSIDELSNCQQICLKTASHCLRMDGEQAEAPTVRLLLDCAYVCERSAEFDRLVNPLQMRGTYEITAELCDRAAQRCEMFRDDSMMLQCAAACRCCAVYCWEKAGMLV